MKTITLLLAALWATTPLLGQFNCNNLQLLDIYQNSVQTNQLSLLLTNTDPVGDGHPGVYTVIQLIHETDTILNSWPDFQLPTSSADTIVYAIPYAEGFLDKFDRNIHYRGKLATQFPSCQINYEIDTVEITERTYSPILDCSEFVIKGIYPRANGGTKGFAMVLSNTSKDTARNWDIGYTSFELFDEEGNPLMERTNPSYYVPNRFGENIVIPFDFYEEIAPNTDITVQMQFPDCSLTYRYRATLSTIEVEPPDILVYPNPTSSQVFLKNATIGSYQLVDSAGKIVWSQIITKAQSNLAIDMTNLAKGTYHLTHMYKGLQQTTQIVKISNE